uniref:Uncharacterized protein n=1 Tax=Tanacetum cinerariifolium TaxID=118510 RepID=A0A699GYL4_TANCI|nr:hypothetical protein [Tanacetum cinerariifolium]
MQALPLAAKAYTMVRQEEKQREGMAVKIGTPIILNSYTNNQRQFTHNNTYPPRNNPPMSNYSNTARRIAFRKGLYYRTCGKEGHNQEECYKTVGYPVCHPLYWKFPPKHNKPNTPYNQRPNMTVNMVMGHDDNIASTSNQA